MPANKIIKNLLLVDDDPDELTIFREATEAIGKDIEVELVSVVRDFETTLILFTPDLIFLDVNLPGMDGFDWLEMLKTKDVTVPVIMYSTSTNKERVHKAYKEGAVIYLPKPIEFLELVESLRIIISMDWTDPDKIRRSFFRNGNFRHFTLDGYYLHTGKFKGTV